MTWKQIKHQNIHLNDFPRNPASLGCAYRGGVVKPDARTNILIIHLWKHVVSLTIICMWHALHQLGAMNPFYWLKKRPDSFTAKLWKRHILYESIQRTPLTSGDASSMAVVEPDAVTDTVKLGPWLTEVVYKNNFLLIFFKWHTKYWCPSQITTVSHKYPAKYKSVLFFFFFSFSFLFM